jgi:hypothetical protein
MASTLAKIHTTISNTQVYSTTTILSCSAAGQTQPAKMYTNGLFKITYVTSDSNTDKANNNNKYERHIHQLK